MKVGIINGANLNLLGTREVQVYGNQTFEDYLTTLKNLFPEIEFAYFQSNIEGEIINKLHEWNKVKKGIIINPGGYSHTSVAISDAIKAIETEVIEVHISNIYAREEYRHTSITGKNCSGVITGFGMKSYQLAIQYLKAV